MARPQTKEKIQEMMERCERRENLFHPQDAGALPIDEHIVKKALADMAMTFSAPSGVAFDKKMRRWRARPWHGRLRYHLGYLMYPETAIRAVRQWMELLEQEGPRAAMFAIRKKVPGWLEQERRQSG